MWGATLTWCGGGGPRSPEDGWVPFLVFITLSLLLGHLEGHLTPGYSQI